MTLNEKIAAANKDAAESRNNATKHNSKFAEAVKNTDTKASEKNDAIYDLNDTNEELDLAKVAAKKQNELDKTKKKLATLKEKENLTPEDKAEIAALEDKEEKQTDEFENARDDYAFSLDDNESNQKADAYNQDFDKIVEDKEADSEWCSDEVQDADDELQTAKENESKVLDEQASLYPETFGKVAKDLKDKYKKVKKLKAQIGSPVPPKIPKITEFDRAAEKANYALQEAKVLARKKAEELVKPDNVIDELLKKEIDSKMDPTSHNAAYLHWDAPPTKNLTGKLEDIIAEHMQPKMKFAYMGEFPDKLQPLDWMVKSMDKPKVDIESVEQLRNNVKRNYPVKYNYGDLSLTFWDDMDHKTVTSLYEYFTQSVWDHAAVSLTGRFMLRDSIVIPKFNIYELTSNSDKHLKYVFENAVLSSFDFDNSEDESDDGVYTIQAVFKIERFETIVNKSPRTLNPDNKPVWL